MLMKVKECKLKKKQSICDRYNIDLDYFYLV